MKTNLKILGLGGSLSSSSTSLKALEIALRGAEQAGAATRTIDVAALKLPLYDPNAEDAPESAKELARAVSEADGLIWSSPLYHGTVSGLFKNALDWLELLSEQGYLNGKPVGLIATAGGSHGLQAVNTMEFVVRALRGLALPRVVPISQAWKGQYPEEQLLALGRELKSTAEKLA